jgi:predicted transcriptional regulator
MNHIESEAVVERVLEREENDSVSRLFEILADERRRILVTILEEQTDPVESVALARLVAAREADVSTEAVPADVVDDVLLTLHHVHLPKMDRAGLLAFEPDDGVVSDVAVPSIG